jgi:hypothetical protein
MAINFSGLTRGALPHTDTHTASERAHGRGGLSSGGSLQHQFAASAGLAARGGLKPAHTVRAKLPALTPSRPAAPVQVAAPLSSPTQPVPLQTPPSVPATAAAVSTTTPASATRVAVLSPHVAAAGPSSSAPAAPPVNVPTPGERTVFAWLPTQPSTPSQASTRRIDGPRFLWAQQAG